MNMDKINRSPISPLLFGALGLYRSDSSDVDGDDSSLCSSSKNSVPSSFALIQRTTLKDLEHAQKRLRSSLRANHDIQCGIERSHSGIQRAMDNVALLDITVSPMLSLSAYLNLVEQLIDRAIAPPAAILFKFDSMRKLARILSEGPLEDVGRYVEGVSLFQQSMQFTCEYAPTAADSLREGLTVLRSKKMIDNFRMRELVDTSTALDNLLEAQEFLALPTATLRGTFEHLAAAFRRILREYGSPIDLSEYFEGNNRERDNERRLLLQPLPSPLVQILQSISEILASNDRLDICLCIYEEERCLKLSESVRTLRPFYFDHFTPETIGTAEWTTLEEQIVMWLRHMEVFVKILLPAEHRLCQQIFASVNSDAWEGTWGRLSFQAGLGSFLTFGEAFAQTRSEPQKLFKLLDAFETLVRLQPSFEKLFQGRGCKGLRKKVRNLYSLIINAACTGFRGIRIQVTKYEESNIPSKGGAVLKLVSYTVNFLNYLLSDFYKPLLCNVLNAEQGWSEGPIQEYVLLRPEILEIMESLRKNVAEVAASQEMREAPALASFFMMNNYRYIYGRAKNSELATLLGESWLQEEQDRVQKVAERYKIEAWGSVTLHLVEKGLLWSGGQGEAAKATKRRLKAFEEAFTAAYERHRSWALIPDAYFRSRIAFDVVQSILPAYRNLVSVISDDPELVDLPPGNVHRMLSRLYTTSSNLSPRAPQFTRSPSESCLLDWSATSLSLAFDEPEDE